MVWILLILAVLVIVFFAPRQESMTNKDLLDTLKTFGDHGTPPKKKEDPDYAPIYGPKTTSVADPKPSHQTKKGKGTDASSYPDIFGPDMNITPGKKCKSGTHESDATCDSTYEFNPDLKKAFPSAEGDPQPFLTDFSKLQH